MGVRIAESELANAAIAFADESGGLEGLTTAALRYSKAKKKARDSRDRWKENRRLTNKGKTANEK